ncbi:MAG TPA: hemolysin family protein [Thermoanaerobaculia bacterium]|nr:hemolysin family protein [Thermoanaerobaculia bacterium]
MAEILFVLAVTAALIVANGMFVAAEFAIIGTSRPAVQAHAQRGDRGARRVAGIVGNPVRLDRYIATAQLGITSASLGLGMYGEHTLAVWILEGFERVGWAAWVGAHGAASVLAVTVMTYFHIVFGEMVPKSLALQHAEATAIRISLPMRWLQWLLSPFILVLNGIGNGLLRVLGIDRRSGAAHMFTPEEIEIIVSETQEKGELPELPGHVVRELFDFFELTAEQVMVPRIHVIGLELGARRADLAAALRKEIHTRYPVYVDDLDHIVGFVHAKDLIRLALENRPLDTATVRPSPYVPGSLSLERVLEMMHRDKAQQVVVLDEHGGTAGILTLEDLFEELVGELDEGDGARPEIARLGEGVLLAEGTARLEEIAEALGVPLRHEDVETVSGLVLAILGRPPAAGDQVVWDGVELRVVTIDGRGVGQTRIRVLHQDRGPDGSARA